MASLVELRFDERPVNIYSAHQEYGALRFALQACFEHRNNAAPAEATRLLQSPQHHAQWSAPQTQISCGASSGRQTEPA